MRSKDRDPMRSLDAAFERAENDHIEFLLNYQEPGDAAMETQPAVPTRINPERITGASRKDRTRAEIKQIRRARRATLATEPLSPSATLRYRAMNGRSN